MKGKWSLDLQHVQPTLDQQRKVETFAWVPEIDQTVGTTAWGLSKRIEISYKLVWKKFPSTYSNK
jgi:hypothetical protein